MKWCLLIWKSRSNLFILQTQIDESKTEMLALRHLFEKTNQELNELREYSKDLECKYQDLLNLKTPRKYTFLTTFTTEQHS